MTCHQCNNENKCDFTVAAMLARPGAAVLAPAWPQDLDAPPPGSPVATSTSTTGGYVTSNCMFAPPNETACQVNVRQVAGKSALYSTSISAANWTTPVGLEPVNGGTSQYTAGAFIVSIPTLDLTACLEVCEITLRVQRDGGAYVVGSATTGAPVGMANLRSAWWATEDNVSFATSTPTGSKFGRRLLSTDGRCNCECLRAWHPYDIPAQLEFTYPAGVVPADTDNVVIEFQVSRTYLATAQCILPERCGQARWAPGLPLV